MRRDKRDKFAVINGDGQSSGQHPKPNLKIVPDSGKKRRADALPANLPPRGLSREEAAAYVGVSPTTFDRMVVEGVMPKPWRFHGCVRWSRPKLDAACDALDNEGGADDPWTRMAQ